MRQLFVYDPDTKRIYYANSRTRREAGHIDGQKSRRPKANVTFTLPDGSRTTRTCGYVAHALLHGRWPRNTLAEKRYAMTLHDDSALIMRWHHKAMAGKIRGKIGGTVKGPINFHDQNIPQELIDAEVA